MKRILLIIEKRKDAVGTINDQLVKHLRGKKHIRIIKINNQMRPRFLRPFVELTNMVKLYFTIKKDDALFFTDPAALKSNLAFFLKNKKAIIVHHLELNPWFYKIFGLRYADLIKRFDEVICVSSFSKKQVLARGIPARKVHAVYSGIDQSIFKPSKKHIDIKDYILLVGTELERKNIANSLRAFALLKKKFQKLKLVKVGGSGGAHYRKKTMADIKRLHLEKDVIFTGFVADKELPAYYSNAQLLLFPSLLEGFGFPVLEAMACGCPVVTSNADPMKDLAGGTQLLVDPKNPKDIAQKCARVLTDKKRRARMITHGKKRAKQFTWKRNAEGMYSIITKLI